MHETESDSNKQKKSPRQSPIADEMMIKYRNERRKEKNDLLSSRCELARTIYPELVIFASLALFLSSASTFDPAYAQQFAVALRHSYSVYNLSSTESDVKLFLSNFFRFLW